jgi:Hemerythrin HHE cation binding domain
MNPTELLVRQHNDILAVFDELDLAVDDIERVRLLVRAGESLQAHTALEQDVFYAAVARQADEVIENALAAHRAIDVLLDETVGTPSVANIKLLRSMIERHFQEEEQRLFPLADRFDDAAAEALADQLRRYARAADESPGAVS